MSKQEKPLTQRAPGTPPVGERVRIEPKPEHKSIYAALSAFQGENPEIKKTKHFGKEGEKMHFMYAPLDEFLNVVRPLTSKHGIAISWEGDEKKDGLVCALYHSTYDVVATIVNNETGIVTREINVLRSMPIKVKREGDMQKVGGDSTYARRYTLSEVLGIASEEDTDIGFREQSAQNAVQTVYDRMRAGIDNHKTPEEIEKTIVVLKKGLKALAEGKPASIGLSKEQHEELLDHAEMKKSFLEGNQEAPADDETVDEEGV